MKEELDCEFKQECINTFDGSEMDEYREGCDCVNCALCEKYWRFYDRRYMQQLKEGVKN